MSEAAAADALLKVAQKGGISPIDSDTAAKKGTRSRPAKVRSHRSDTVYKQDMPKYLDKLHVDGYTAEFVVPAIDIRGFEVISYKEV